MRCTILWVLALVGCTGDIDPPWELDHDRIIAVRATPPAILSGERSEIDALLGQKGGATFEQAPEAATVVSPMALMGAVAIDSGKWVVTGPSEDALAAARTELKLSPGDPVPLRVGVAYGGGKLVALKTVVIGRSAQNPTLSEMMIDGMPMESMTELVVGREVEIRFSVAAIVEDDVNWLTNVGEMHDFDLPQSYLIVPKDEEMTMGELAVVKRDIDGGVVWRVWPIRSD